MRRSRHPVPRQHQPLAHEREHRADQRQQPVLRVHVPRRQRLQPGEPQPHEVREGRRRVRHRGVQARGADRVHRAGDHRRQRELSHAAHRREQPRLPAHRSGVREPGCAAHEPWPRLRLRGRPRLLGGRHRAHAVGGCTPVRPHRARPGRRLRRLRHQPRAVPQGHAPASRCGVSDRSPARADRPARRHAHRLGRGRGAGGDSQASATGSCPCWRRPAPSPS